jgi:ABC-2 type transport system ATP-binding protein
MLSLYEIVELFALLYESTPDINDILSRVGLLNKKQARFKELSGGQQQRLSIAVALVNNPKILFFDEPTTGLDPQARRNMWELIQSFKNDGKTIMLTTHYMEEAEELCDRVAIIDEGLIIKIGSPASLIDELTKSGFKSSKKIRGATLEDVFIHLTGKSLRED